MCSDVLRRGAYAGPVVVRVPMVLGASLVMARRVLMDLGVGALMRRSDEACGYSSEVLAGWPCPPYRL